MALDAIFESLNWSSTTSQDAHDKPINTCRNRYTCMCVCTCKYIHTYTLAHTHTPMLTLILTQTQTHTHRHTDTQTHRHTDTQTHRHTDTQTHRHTDTQTHRHTDAHTHTLTLTTGTNRCVLPSPEDPYALQRSDQEAITLYRENFGAMLTHQLTRPSCVPMLRVV